MAKSQQTFSKKEREKKKRKKKQAKIEERQRRKLEKKERGKLTFEDQISYVDYNGNLTSTPPDPTKKEKIKAEEIVLGIPPKVDDSDESDKSGKVKFFNEEKGFGFIVEDVSKESIFVHANDLSIQLKEGDKVSFKIESGIKGPKAVELQLI
jgi:cold shock CspA family protein